MLETAVSALFLLTYDRSALLVSKSRVWSRGTNPSLPGACTRLTFYRPLGSALP